jgi:hypothetical protein
MEKKKVIIAGPIAIAGITLILVVKLSVNCQPAGNNMVFSGVKQPVGLVVKSPWTNKAFDLDGDEVPISTLLEETPGLASMLEIKS